MALMNFYTRIQDTLHNVNQESAAEHDETVEDSYFYETVFKYSLLLLNIYVVGSK